MIALKRIAVSLVCLGLCCPSAALAWGPKGHTMINAIAARTLPKSMPAFVTSAAAQAEIATLGPEEDRLKGSGESWDRDYDPGHYLDLGDDCTIAGAVKLDALPSDMDAYDAALRAAGTSPYKQGYLPYNILDGWEQLRTDFGYWRVYAFLAAHGPNAATRARAAYAQHLRETLILRDIGVWGHFVADASQPLHVTIHYDGWGNYPNPHGYPQAKGLHAKFESRFVDEHATLPAVLAKVKPFVAPSMVEPGPSIAQAQMLARIERYLAATAATVPHVYQIEAQGGWDSGSPAAIALVDSRLAAGASELRDLIALAYDDSINIEIGYPASPVQAIVDGRANAGDSVF